MRLIDCRIIFKDQAVMVNELHLRLGKETKVCITSSFNLLHLPGTAPSGCGVEPKHFVALSLLSSSWFFSSVGDLLLAFCHSRLECLSLGPGSLVTSSTNGQYKVCLLSAKYCRQMYVLGRHRQM